MKLSRNELSEALIDWGVFGQENPDSSDLASDDSVSSTGLVVHDVRSCATLVFTIALSWSGVLRVCSYCSQRLLHSNFAFQPVVEDRKIDWRNAKKLAPYSSELPRPQDANLQEQLSRSSG